MLGRFHSGPLSDRLRQAEATLRELDFLRQLNLPDGGSVVLRGQIDLLARDEEGWTVIDYKSDRVTPDEVAERAAGYELQLMLYSDAVRQHTGEPPRHASLYFLQPGVEQTIPVDEPALQRAREATAAVAGRLLAARRSGVYPPCGRPTCAFCRRDDLRALGASD
jgi:ATP-dependent helicase/nuclease subunit A